MLYFPVRITGVALGLNRNWRSSFYSQTWLNVRHVTIFSITTKGRDSHFVFLHSWSCSQNSERKRTWKHLGILPKTGSAVFKVSDFPIEINRTAINSRLWCFKTQGEVNACEYGTISISEKQAPSISLKNMQQLSRDFHWIKIWI